MNVCDELGSSVKGDTGHLCAGVWKRGGARGAGGRGAGDRNALRARTMPSPITYMSSYIACPRSTQLLCLHTYFFWQFSYIPRLTDSTDYSSVSRCFDDIKEYPFVILYIDGHNHNRQFIFLFTFYIVLDYSPAYLWEP